MTDRDDDLIKKRAYALWEAEGRPEGRHDAHWDQAFQELSNSDGASVLGVPEGDEPPADVPSPVEKAEKSAPSLSVLEGGAGSTPGGKRKRKV